MRLNNTKINKWRILGRPPYWPDSAPSPSHADGNNGHFWIPFQGRKMLVLASDGEGWDHVSVSFGKGSKKCPNWAQMCFIKELFFEDYEWVVQFHPAQDANISHHAFCLHLWRHQSIEFPQPEGILVGPRPARAVG